MVSAMNSQLKAVFFDMGGTLGTVDQDSFKLTLYADSKALLDLFKRVLGLKLGIISNTPPKFTQEQFLAMLDAAGIEQFFDSECLLASSVVRMDKSQPKLFL